MKQDHQTSTTGSKIKNVAKKQAKKSTGKKKATTYFGISNRIKKTTSINICEGDGCDDKIKNIISISIVKGEGKNGPGVVCLTIPFNDIHMTVKEMYKLIREKIGEWEKKDDIAEYTGIADDYVLVGEDGREFPFRYGDFFKKYDGFFKKSFIKKKEKKSYEVKISRQCDDNKNVFYGPFDKETTKKINNHHRFGYTMWEYMTMGTMVPSSSRKFTEVLDHTIHKTIVHETRVVHVRMVPKEEVVDINVTHTCTECNGSSDTYSGGSSRVSHTGICDRKLDIAVNGICYECSLKEIKEIKMPLVVECGCCHKDITSIYQEGSTSWSFGERKSCEECTINAMIRRSNTSSHVLERVSVDEDKRIG